MASPLVDTPIKPRRLDDSTRAVLSTETKKMLKTFQKKYAGASEDIRREIFSEINKEMRRHYEPTTRPPKVHTEFSVINEDAFDFYLLGIFYYF